jgi:GNAT superfamily N-acetyltransferase
MSVVQPIIREAVPQDAALISELVAQYWAFEEIDGYCAEDVAKLLSDALAAPDHVRCWLAERNGVLIGYLLTVLVFSLEHRGVMAEVDEFFVVPDARGTGVSASLLEQAERALAARGIVRLQLQLGVTNAVGRAFYKRNGYAQRSGYEIWDKPMAVV